jgi:hypothetical protein
VKKEGEKNLNHLFFFEIHLNYSHDTISLNSKSTIYFYIIIVARGSQQVTETGVYFPEIFGRSVLFQNYKDKHSNHGNSMKLNWSIIFLFNQLLNQEQNVRMLFQFVSYRSFKLGFYYFHDQQENINMKQA